MLWTQGKETILKEPNNFPALMNKIFQKITSNGIVSLLSYPPYLYFSLSVFFSQVAFNMLNIVLIFLIFHLTSSNLAVSFLLFSILIPQILLSFIGGVIADVSNKKKILIFGNLIRGIVLILLFYNLKSVFIIYPVALIISAITQFYVPAEAPLIPALVKKEKLVPANSIFGIGLFGSILIGYVLAGPAVNLLGRPGVFLGLSAIFVISAFFAFMISDKKIIESKIKLSESGLKKSIGEELRNSYSIIRKTKEVGDAFFLLIFSQIIIFILATLIPGYARNILQVPAEDLSIILFAPAAVGMLLSAMLIGSVLHRVKKNNLMKIGVFMSGAVLVFLPFTSRIFSRGIIDFINLFMPEFFHINIFSFVLLLAFLAGLANAFIFIPSQATIQEHIPQDFRSKIYGLLFAFIGVFSLFPILIAGGIADIIGVGSVLLFIGLAIIAIGLIREKFLFSFFWWIARKK